MKQQLFPNLRPPSGTIDPKQFLRDEAILNRPLPPPSRFPQWEGPGNPGWEARQVQAFNDPTTRIIGGQDTDYKRGFNDPEVRIVLPPSMTRPIGPGFKPQPQPIYPIGRDSVKQPRQLPSWFSPNLEKQDAMDLDIFQRGGTRAGMSPDFLARMQDAWTTSGGIGPINAGFMVKVGQGKIALPPRAAQPPKVGLPRTQPQPKIDYSGAPAGTPPPTMPLPPGSIGWFWDRYRGTWAPNYQYRPMSR